MSTRKSFEEFYLSLHKQTVENSTYKSFVDGSANRKDAVTFVEQVCKAHLRSPQILGFLFAMVPPKSRDHLEHNLLEELGKEEDGCASHPDLLRQLAEAIPEIDKNWQSIEAAAEETLTHKATEPLLFGTLLESGFSVALEVFAFEWFLARESSRLGMAVQSYLSLEKNKMEWFFHHSEVDIEHAEQGLDALVNFVECYEMDTDTVNTIAEITFRENIFLKRYFDIQTEARL